ncbi:polysaccharide deacetylase family protein [Rubeoparvulum massiliense]|uniref:polysaccharide deacetylase family protein n=1 Tax=Rubeoparvulum massiliense TaxID=1631346 RepID=UPI00069DF1BF|nr:polysaccharide deacetylase family protein [Rubeoparvulum massiliense]
MWNPNQAGFNRIRWILISTTVIMMLLTLSVHALHEPIFRSNTEQKVVAITFDDGPDPTYTPQILQRLQFHQVPATFFMLGSQAERYPAIVREVQQQGHEIGNHGYHHLQLENLSKEHIQREIQRTNQVIQRITGKPVRYYRPPNGVITHQVLQAVEAEGQLLIFWSVDPKDWSLKRTAEVIAKSVQGKVKPGDIILFHDGGLNQQALLSALDSLILDLKAEGYRFVTIPQLLNNH